MVARIMVIDNQSSSQELAAFHFRNVGYEVFCFDYTQIKLASLKELQPDLILVDFDMPDNGPGWEFLQLLKMDDSTAKIPVIITTPTFLLSAEIRRYLLERYIRVVSKPIDFPELILLIQKTLEMAHQAGTIFTSASNLPVLVVDDSEPLRDALSFVLRMEHYRVVTAANGLLALEAVHNAEFCLISLDIDMPVMDGFGFLSAYGQQLRPHTPIIIISGNDAIADKVLPNFVVDVFAKPLEISQLLGAVKKHVIRA
jgi:CheY-like chemotaxis protein